MKNQKNFIPNNLMQPDRYEMLFNCWNAIYVHPETGKEYMIEAVPKDSMLPLGEVKHLCVLTRSESQHCRIQLGEFPSCKQAVSYIQSIFDAASGPESDSESVETDYNGQKINCPDCGNEIIIEYDTARCDDCGWMCADAELDDIMNA